MTSPSLATSKIINADVLWVCGVALVKACVGDCGGGGVTLDLLMDNHSWRRSLFEGSRSRSHQIKITPDQDLDQFLYHLSKLFYKVIQKTAVLDRFLYHLSKLFYNLDPLLIKIKIINKDLDHLEDQDHFHQHNFNFSTMRRCKEHVETKWDKITKVYPEISPYWNLWHNLK